jgi:chromosome segregation ATPase
LGDWTRSKQKRLEATVKRLESDHEKLLHRCDELNKQLQSERTEYLKKLQESEDKIFKQLKDAPDVNLLKIQEEIKHLELENEDLLARENAKTQRLKEIKEEANQTRFESAEKINELQLEIEEKEREIDTLRHKILEGESLIEIKDEQIEELEKSMCKLSDTNNEINYYAELIDTKIRLQHTESQLASKELRLTSLQSELSSLTISISTLKSTNQSLESQISLHESDYSLLSLEVDSFTHSLTHLQSQISKLTSLLHQKDPPISTTSISLPPSSPSLINSCPLQACINRLTAKLHSFIPSDSAALPFIYQGKIRSDHRNVHYNSPGRRRSSSGQSTPFRSGHRRQTGL